MTLGAFKNRTGWIVGQKAKYQFQYFWVRLWQWNRALNLMDSVGGEQQVGCRQVESHYNRPLISTNREHRRRAPCIHSGILKHTWRHAYAHTYTQNPLQQSTAQQYRLGSLHPTHSFPPLPQGSWPHSGSTPSHGEPCVSIQQSEKQQHQWAHIIIHLTAPRAWHLLTVLLFRLSAALLPFSLHYSAQERAALFGGWGLVWTAGDPALKHSVANIKYDWPRVFYHMCLTLDRSEWKKRLCLPDDDSDGPGGSADMKKREKQLVS